jgi:hypothetical protein
MNLSLAQDHLLLEQPHVSGKSNHDTVSILPIVTGLATFEGINFTATSLALRGLLGGFSVMGANIVLWLAATICCLDIAGIFYLFLPLSSSSRPTPSRRLFGVWLLAALLNTWLIWRGINLAIAYHQVQIGWVIDADILMNTLPGFIVCLLWLIRVLIIGSLSRSRQSQHIINNGTEELRILEEASRVQASFSFDQLPHGIDGLYPPYSLGAPRVTCTQDPMYRGIPVRYKTS